MTRSLSFSAILRSIPKLTVRRFIDKIGLGFMEIDSNASQPLEIGSFLQAMSRLDAARQLHAEKTLHDIFQMASDNGAAAIREVADDEVGQSISQDDDPVNLAMDAWLNHRNIFDRARLLCRAGRFGYWHRRVALPHVVPKSETHALKLFGKSMAGLLEGERGCCRHCFVEHVRCSDGADYFFAYPDGMCRTHLIHNAGGNLIAHSVRPTLQVVFVYDHNEGVLETSANLPPKLELQLENLFCRIMLDNDAMPLLRPVYDLNVLKEGPANLVTDPEDGIAASIQRMRLNVLNSQRIIILVSDHAGCREDVYVMLRECLNRECLPLSVLDVTAAQFFLEFRPTNGRGPEAITFNVKYPDLCTLRNHRPDRAAMAQKYLRKWRIAVA